MNSEVTKRLELAKLYTKLSQKSFFKAEDEYSAVVEAELKAFIASRLEQLFGISKESVSFDDNETKALKAVAGAVLKGPQKAEQEQKEPEPNPAVTTQPVAKPVAMAKPAAKAIATKSNQTAVKEFTNELGEEFVTEKTGGRLVTYQKVYNNDGTFKKIAVPNRVNKMTEDEYEDAVHKSQAMASMTIDKQYENNESTAMNHNILKQLANKIAEQKQKQ